MMCMAKSFIINTETFHKNKKVIFDFSSDETLNRGPDSPSKKSRSVTLASWPNLPIGL